MAALSVRRCVVGRDVTALGVSADGITLEGRLRLRPGTVVEVCDVMVRLGVIESWSVARLGQDGPVFRGFCRWRHAGGAAAPDTHGAGTGARGQRAR